LHLLGILLLLLVPQDIKLSPAQDKNLREAVEKVKDANRAVETAQKDARITLLSIILEVAKANPGFDEKLYDVQLVDGIYTLKKKEVKKEDKK
jgi:hypothetical protein